MSKPYLPVRRLQDLIIAELRKIDELVDLGVDALTIHPTDTAWIATLRTKGGRIDEARCAAVREASARLATRYGLMR